MTRDSQNGNFHGRFFVLFRRDGVRLSPLGTSATVVLASDDEYGAFNGMRIGRENRSTHRKTAPVPRCPLR
jgi:hypothetical protein